MMFTSLRTCTQLEDCRASFVTGPPTTLGLIGGEIPSKRRSQGIDSGVQGSLFVLSFEPESHVANLAAFCLITQDLFRIFWTNRSVLGIISP